MDWGRGLLRGSVQNRALPGSLQWWWESCFSPEDVAREPGNSGSATSLGGKGSQGTGEAGKVSGGQRLESALFLRLPQASIHPEGLGQVAHWAALCDGLGGIWTTFEQGAAITSLSGVSSGQQGSFLQWAGMGDFGRWTAVDL